VSVRVTITIRGLTEQSMPRSELSLFQTGHHLFSRCGRGRACESVDDHVVGARTALARRYGAGSATQLGSAAIHGHVSLTLLGPRVQLINRELHLRHQLDSLRTLLGQTKNEPRLKGPFPFDFYKDVLLSCERIVDRLHSMRCVTTRDEWSAVHLTRPRAQTDPAGTTCVLTLV
jgi:hypothetical protein